jgi:hypothetical protein
MTRRRALAAVVLVTAVSVFAWASPASAHNPAVVTARKVTIKAGTNQMTCALPLPYVCDPAPGNDAVVRIVVPDQFRPVQQVCITLHFRGDLLDAGETVLVQGIGGFTNSGPGSLREREVCNNRRNQPEATRLFNDGRQTIHVYMEEGSACLESVDVVVTGRRP